MDSNMPLFQNFHSALHFSLREFEKNLKLKLLKEILRKKSFFYPYIQAPCKNKMIKLQFFIFDCSEQITRIIPQKTRTTLIIFVKEISSLKKIAPKIIPQSKSAARFA